MVHRLLLVACLAIIRAPSCQTASNAPQSSEPAPGNAADSLVQPGSPNEAETLDQTFVPEPLTDRYTVVESPDSVEDLGRFEELTFRDSLVLTSTWPADSLAEQVLALLSLLPEAEGQETAYRTSISVLRQAQDHTTVLYTMLGGGDDSVSGLRYQIEMAHRDSTWSVLKVGRQVKCWKGRGHEDWGDQRCR